MFHVITSRYFSWREEREFTPTLVVTGLFNLLQRVPTFVKPVVASISTSAFIILNQYQYHWANFWHQQRHLCTFLDFTTSSIPSRSSSRAGKFLSFAPNWQKALAELSSVPSIISSTRARQGFRVVCFVKAGKQSDLAILSSLKQHDGVFWSPVANHHFHNHDHLQATGKHGWWNHVHYWRLWGLWQLCQGEKFQSGSWPDLKLRIDLLTKDIISFSPSALAASISGKLSQLSASFITCVGLPTSFLLLPSSQLTLA